MKHDNVIIDVFKLHYNPIIDNKFYIRSLQCQLSLEDKNQDAKSYYTLNLRVHMRIK